ncbi:MAG: hypothetical protein V1773_17915 [bacterium]
MGIQAEKFGTAIEVSKTACEISAIAKLSTINRYSFCSANFTGCVKIKNSSNVTKYVGIGGGAYGYKQGTSLPCLCAIYIR